MRAYLRHAASFDHDTGPHPENAGRIRAIEAALEAEDWLGLDVLEAPRVTREQLDRVHTAAAIDLVERVAESGGGMLDPDTVVSAGSWEAALRAAGGACEGARLALEAGEGFAISALRPPGHHAETSRQMGFCLFNNAAVAVADSIARGAIERALIFDWDVHHGNGTQEIFWSRGDVAYVSIHQWPFYPGTGARDEVGAGEGEGLTLNFPVPGGTGGEVFREIAEREVAPLIADFKPGLVAISAGYDAHRADPLASCELVDADYEAMAATVGAAAREVGAPVLVCLEGGYDPAALAASLIATVNGLDSAN
jgi:acetoin utilization deacetylase AcuC-like enzyme